MKKPDVALKLKEFLLNLPSWQNRPPEKIKPRLGVLVPTLPDTPGEVRKARDAGWIEPVLLGSERDITVFEALSGCRDCEKVIADDANDAAVQAVAEKRIDVLMRGATGVHVLFSKLVKATEFRAGWMSQVALLLPPKLPDRFLLLSDSGMTLSPSLEQKVRIIENTLIVARKLDFNPPKVALLAAVETVSPDLTVGMHDAILAKMGERGQFGNALLEGPLALDLALSEEAAIKKKVKSPVAGHANVLIAPTLEVGNGLYKAMITLAGAAAASVVVGGTIPLALPSRSDKSEAIAASILLACLLS